MSKSSNELMPTGFIKNELIERSTSKSLMSLFLIHEFKADCPIGEKNKISVSKVRPILVTVIFFAVRQCFWVKPMC